MNESLAGAGREVGAVGAAGGAVSVAIVELKKWRREKKDVVRCNANRISQSRQGLRDVTQRAWILITKSWQLDARLHQHW